MCRICPVACSYAVRLAYTCMPNVCIWHTFNAKYTRYLYCRVYLAYTCQMRMYLRCRWIGTRPSCRTRRGLRAVEKGPGCFFALAMQSPLLFTAQAGIELAHFLQHFFRFCFKEIETPRLSFFRDGESWARGSQQKCGLLFLKAARLALLLTGCAQLSAVVCTP